MPAGVHARCHAQAGKTKPRLALIGLAVPERGTGTRVARSESQALLEHDIDWNVRRLDSS